MARPRTDTRERLLADAVAYVTAHGVSELSLRDLAAGLGTSPRMLIFHFGSKEELLVEIVRSAEEGQREFLLQPIATDGPEEPTAVLRSLWHHLLDPVLAPFERLFFELYGQALQGRGHSATFLDGIVETWLTPVAELFTQMGHPEDRARQEARLAVAVIRGLLLDVLATGEQAAATEAFERYLAPYEKPSVDG